MGETAKLHSDLEALVGSTIHDRYEVESLLGAGGMGAVFKARHTGLQRGVAIKVLHPEIGRDESVSKRFDREAHSASRLDHPNCVRVSDFGTTDKGTKYLVMELLEGGDLDGRLGRPWPPGQAIATIEQVLYGLEHAHHVGIVHRDLKPENIFITRDFKGEEVVKIVDFGIAKLIDEQGSEKLTRQGIVFGTPRYMSPEQAAGGKIDERTDLYAVGLILYELLAGGPPFETDDPAQLLRMQIMAPPAPLPESVPAELVAIVAKLLEKSKADRYASAREVLDALAVAKSSVAAVVPVVATGPLPVAAIGPEVSSSGVAWQPAPSPTEPIPAISGATLAAPAAELAAASMSGSAASTAGATGPSHPSMSVASVTANYEPAPSSSRRWLPLALAGATSLLVLAGVGVLLSSLDEAPASEASQLEDAPAAVAKNQAVDRETPDADDVPADQPPSREPNPAIAPGPVRDNPAPAARPIRSIERNESSDAKPSPAPGTDSKPTDSKPTDSKPTDSEPTDSKPTDNEDGGSSDASGSSDPSKPTDSTDRESGVEADDAEQKRREAAAEQEKREREAKQREDEKARDQSKGKGKGKDKGKAKGKGNDEKKPS